MLTNYGLYAVYDSVIGAFIPGEGLMVNLTDEYAVSAFATTIRDIKEADKKSQALDRYRFYRLGYVDVVNVSQPLKVDVKELTSNVVSMVNSFSVKEGAE